MIHDNVCLNESPQMSQIYNTDEIKSYVHINLPTKAAPAPLFGFGSSFSKFHSPVSGLKLSNELKECLKYPPAE